MKKNNIKSSMQLLLLAIFLIVFAHCEPNTIDEPIVETIDSCEQYAGIKNVFKINFNGIDWQADSIRISEINSEAEAFLINGYILNGLQRSDASSIGAGLIISPLNSMVTFSMGTNDSTWVALLGHPANFLFWSVDSINESYCGKFTIDYDDLRFGKGHIECEYINMDRKISYYPHSYELDTIKDYPYTKVWYYVGCSNGLLSNFKRPIPWTLNIPQLVFYADSLGEAYENIYKYKYYAEAYRGMGPLYGSWNLEEENFQTAFFSSGYIINYDWDVEWMAFHDSLFTNENNYHFKKENNILKVFFDNNKQCLIYYAKPEEYDYIPSKSKTLKTKNYEEQNNKPTIERFLHWNN